MIAAIDAHIVTNAAVLINNGITNITTFANTQFWQASFYRVLHFFNGLKIIGAHNVTAYHRSTMANTAANTYYTVLNAAGINNTAFGNDRFLKCSAAYFGRWQHAGAGINRVA